MECRATRIGKEGWAYYRNGFRNSSTLTTFMLPTSRAACWNQLFSSAHRSALHLSQVFLITSSAWRGMLGLLLVFTDTMLTSELVAKKKKSSKQTKSCLSGKGTSLLQELDRSLSSLLNSFPSVSVGFLLPGLHDRSMRVRIRTSASWCCWV